MAKDFSKEQEIEQSFDWAIIKKLYIYLKPKLYLFILCIFLIVGMTAIDLSIPYFTKVAIDDYIVGHNKMMTITEAPLDENDILFEEDFYHRISRNEVKDQSYPDASIRQLVRVDDTSYLINPLALDLERYEDNNTQYNALVKDNGKALTETEYNLFREKDQSNLLNIALLLVGLLLLNFVLGFFNMVVLNYGSQKIIYQIRSDLFGHIQSQSLSFFDNNPVGRLVTRVTNDIDNISKMFTDVLVTALKDLFLIVGTIIVMVGMSPKLALIALSTIPIVLGAAYVFRIKARDVQRRVKTTLARINSTLAENINGMKIIQLFNREELTYNEFDEINHDHLEASIEETRLFAIFRPSMNLIYTISLSLIIWYGGGKSIQNAIELGIIVAFTQYINQFFRPIFDLAEKFNIFQSAMASSERIFLLLETDTEIKTQEDPAKFSNEFKGELAFEDVWFSYTDDDNYVLKGVDFNVKKGETIALVGATGSGKTTIISLLNRFYDIQKGKIKVDGIDIKELDKKDLREKIGIVLQDVFLFAGDIKGNITLNTDIPMNKVEEISKYVNADNFIQKLPEQYDEEVKERGSTLSAGQRQLLSFARALAFDPEVLILDEATSNIDTETELLIQNAIEKLVKDRTTIIVAHRLSTIKNADKIIVMHKGEIKEIGNHDALIRQGGLYHDLYQLQYQ